MSVLRIMMGCPGSGKSTFATSMMMTGEVYVSRDAIRFSMITEDDEYFSKEDEVFNKFIEIIDVNLAAGKTVYANATHLNRKARLKLLNSLTVKPDFIEIIYMKTPLEVCLERNNKRKGTRAFVPRSVIRRMYASIEEPKYKEGKYEYTVIWVKEPDCVIGVKEGMKDVDLRDE